MAGKIMDLPNVSCFLVTIAMDATLVLPWLIAEIGSTMMTGTQAARYRRPVERDMFGSALPPRSPIWDRQIKAISRP